MENCPVCDSTIDETNDSITLDCRHRACKACLTIFREQGQVCPASSHCKAFSLTLTLADGSQESEVMALERKRKEADVIDEKKLAIDLRLTLESDHADLLLRRTIETAKNYDKGKLDRVKNRAVRGIERRLCGYISELDRWPISAIKNNDTRLILHIIHKISPYKNNLPPISGPQTLKKAAEALGGLSSAQEVLLAKAESASFVSKNYYVSPEQFLVNFGDYQLRWTDKKGWEFGEFPLLEPRYTFMVDNYLCAYETGQRIVLLNFTPDPIRYQRKSAKAAKEHKKTMDAAIAKHKVEGDKLCFELKCIETEIEILETNLEQAAVSSVTMDVPKVTAYVHRTAERLEFGEAKVQKQYSGYLHNEIVWLFTAPKHNVIPLTHNVVLIRGLWCTVLHTCEMVGKQRVRGSKVAEISLHNITRGYVSDDEFWFREKFADREEWKCVSLQLATLGEPIVCERPPEPIYPANKEYGDNMLTVRHDSTREMLWIGLLRLSGKPHVLGALPY
jgi:hypothetical protein